MPVSSWCEMTRELSSASVEQFNPKRSATTMCTQRFAEYNCGYRTERSSSNVIAYTTASQTSRATNSARKAWCPKKIKGHLDAPLANGIATIPTEQGYGLLASDPDAIDRSFAAKRRGDGHPLGVIGYLELSDGVHLIPERHCEMLRVWAQELDMPIGVVEPYRAEHPLLARLGAETVARHTKAGTLAMFVGGPPLLREVVRLVVAEGRVVLGSSTNLTGRGQKFCWEDVEDEVKEAADVNIDYGLQRAHVYNVGTMNFDFEHLKVLRFGSCYELFRDYMYRFWKVELPEGPPPPRLPPEAEGFQHQVG